MEHASPKSLILKYTGIFSVVYALIWLVPGIVVYPADKFLEFYRGVEIVDSWTPGLMAWTIAVIVLPILFMLVMLVVYFRARKPSGG
jgi:hypothetical protein